LNAEVEAELNEHLKAWAAEAGADLVADEDTVAMLFVSGKSATPKKTAKGKKAPVKSSGGLFSAFAKGGKSVKKNKGPGPLYGSTPSILVKS